MEHKEYLELVEPACKSQYNFIGWLAFIGGLFFFGGIVWLFVDMYLTSSGKEAVEPYVWAGIILLAGGTAYYLAYMEMDTGNAIIATQNRVNFGSIFIAFIVSSIILFFGIHMFASKVSSYLISNIDQDRTVMELNHQIQNERSDRRARQLKTMKLQRINELQEEIENKSFLIAGLFALFGLIIRITYAFSYMTKDGINIPFLKRDEEREPFEFEGTSNIQPFTPFTKDHNLVKRDAMILGSLANVKRKGEQITRSEFMEISKLGRTTALTIMNDYVTKGILTKSEDGSFYYTGSQTPYSAA